VKKAALELLVVLLVNILCGALMLKIGLEIGYSEAMDKRVTCVEEGK
jgi:hypothetical protein